MEIVALSETSYVYRSPRNCVSTKSTIECIARVAYYLSNDVKRCGQSAQKVTLSRNQNRKYNAPPAYRLASDDIIVLRCCIMWLPRIIQCKQHNDTTKNKRYLFECFGER